MIEVEVLDRAASSDRLMKKRMRGVKWDGILLIRYVTTLNVVPIQTVKP